MDARGINQKDIATTLRISKSTVARAKRKQKETGDIEGGGKKRGPKGKLDDGMRNVLLYFRILMDTNAKVLLKMILENPEYRLIQYLNALEERYGVKLSISRLSQFLADHDINRKKVLFLTTSY